MSPPPHGIAPVAVDAMGGDHAPGAAVQGAVAAARAGQAVILVGPEGKVREEIKRQRAPSSLPIRVHHAAEVVEMGEHPGQAMRRKRDNSIRVAFELVRAGEASAMVSAGNSGAVMAGAILVLGRLGAVERPALAQVLPAVKGRPLLLDMGANVECKPIHLVQFALMGEVWSRRVVGVHRPRVAILANGEEASKGTELTRRAAAALEHAPLRFAGYCEGRDLLTGEFDVVVTDGFTGNVALKTMEGTARAVRQLVRQALRSTVPSKIGALFAQKALREVKRRVDWREVGGAPLLGVAGVGVVSHGASDALAIENAVARACDAARAACTGEMAEAAARAPELLAGPPARHGRALEA
ncbi:MAG TPA: phosphate acyltransferase PlsX [Anaeromyxobacteraceae bacterium]|nr:phosphate acyltransferase PlsX [Anaeromyxobacteraceae bacterium]